MKCVKNARRVRDIRIFGAVARVEGDDRSDVDILVSSSLTTSLLADNHEIARSTATNDVPKLAAKLRAAIGARLEWMVPGEPVSGR